MRSLVHDLAVFDLRAASSRAAVARRQWLAAIEHMAMRAVTDGGGGVREQVAEIIGTLLLGESQVRRPALCFECSPLALLHLSPFGSRISKQCTATGQEFVALVSAVVRSPLSVN